MKGRLVVFAIGPLVLLGGRQHNSIIFSVLVIQMLLGVGRGTLSLLSRCFLCLQELAPVGILLLEGFRAMSLFTLRRLLLFSSIRGTHNIIVMLGC